jgi:hypothetical protein
MPVFEVAYELKMSVSQVMEMEYEELLKWCDYFEQRPIGWREDLRFLKVLQAAGVKESPAKLFSSIAQMEQNRGAEIRRRDGALDVENLKRSALFSKMLSATGGVNIFDDQNKV